MPIIKNFKSVFGLHSATFNAPVYKMSLLCFPLDFPRFALFLPYYKDLTYYRTCLGLAPETLTQLVPHY